MISDIKTTLETSTSNIQRPGAPAPKRKKKKSSFSAVGINYKPLAELLYQRKWQEADKLTQRLMLKASGDELSTWIDRKAMSGFPCLDLQTIDKLWVKYSKGQFGFSIQKRIYHSLGGKRSHDRQAWEALADQVGWRVNGTWLFPEDLDFSNNAPLGHLPSLALSGTLDRGIYTLVSRMIDCQSG